MYADAQRRANYKANVAYRADAVYKAALAAHVALDVAEATSTG
jgi:hypothetical protein